MGLCRLSAGRRPINPVQVTPGTRAAQDQPGPPSLFRSARFQHGEVVYPSHPLEAALQAPDSNGRKYARARRMKANEGSTA